MKTIGDEVMVVSPDAGLADRVGGRPSSPASRSGRSRGSGSTAATPSTATATTSAARSTSPTGSSTGPRPARCWSPTRVVDAIAGQRAARARADRRGQPEGLPRAHRALRRPRRRLSGEPERAASGSARRAAADRAAGGRWSRCSPAAATRSACSTSRCARRGPDAVTRAARQLRPARRLRRGRAPLRRALRAARGGARGRAAAPPRGAGQPAGLGAGRPLRGGGAAGAEPSGATIATGHTADDQVETILYRLASSPSRRALLGMRPRDGSLVRPLLGSTRERDDRLLRGARPRLARRPDQRGARLRPQPGPPRACCRRWPRIHPAAARERAAHGRAAARRGRGARRARRRRARRLAAARRAARSRSSGFAELPPALRRLVVQRLADDAAGRPVPGAARHAEEVAACAAPAPRCSTSAAASAPSLERGVLRAER